MKYLIITWLFIKRVIKNPTFIVLLIAVPVLITAFTKIYSKDEKRINVGIYYEKDELSKTISESLKNKAGYIKFVIYKDKGDMVNDVENKSLECGYIFPSDFKEKLDAGKFKRSITCIESPSSILSNLSDEVVFGNIIEEYGKNIAINFAEENNIVKGNKNSVSEEITKDYNMFNTPEKTFSINYKYVGTNGQISAGDGEKTGTYIIHGIMSVLILIAALFGAINWFGDEKKGLYASFNIKEKIIIGFMSILVPSAIMAFASMITIYISNVYTNILKEIAAMILYILIVSGFSYLLKIIVKSGTDICAAIPAITLGSLIFCPVFVDVSKFMPFISSVNKVLPTFYYLNGITNGTSGLIIMFIISIFLIFSGSLIYVIKER